MKLIKQIPLLSIILSILTLSCGRPDIEQTRSEWIDRPQDQWPQIAMINQIEYIDAHHPVAGCAFLLDTGRDTVAVTAKHVLIYFKSEAMQYVSFGNTLVNWRMYPKNSPEDVVVVDHLINEDSSERIEYMPSGVDWLAFSIKEASPDIQPLKLREAPLVKGEEVYIIGWRYTDVNCPQKVYQGNYVSSEPGAVIISTLELADNTTPGLSGAPVVDSNGHLIGLMSQKHGKLEKLASVDYVKEILEEWEKER